MTRYALILEKRETIIRTSDLPAEAWDFWTFSERWVKRLKKLGYQLEKDHQGGWSCRIPFDRIKVIKPEKRKATGRPFGSKAHAESRILPLGAGAPK